MASKEDVDRVQTSSPLVENSDGISAQLVTNEVAKSLSPILNDPQQENNTARNQTDYNICDDTESSPSKTVPGSPASGHKTWLASPIPSAEPGPSISTSQKGVNVESTAKSLPCPIKRDVGAFLRKFLDSRQPQVIPTTPPPVKIAEPPPELEDDFQILEEEVPIFFSLSSRSGLKRQISKTPLNGRGSSMDKALKDRCQDMQASNQEQTLCKEANKSPRAHLDGPDNENQQRPREIVNKELKEAVGSQTNEQKGTKKLPKKSKDNKKSSSWEAKSKGIKIRDQKPRSQEPTKHGASPSVNDIKKYKSEKDLAPETTDQYPESSPSQLSHLEDCRILGKRKRKPPGEWWVRCPQNVAKDNAPSVKKPKANPKETPKAKKAPKSTIKKEARLTAQMKTPANDRNTHEAEQMEGQDSAPCLFSPDIMEKEPSHKAASQRAGKKRVSIQPAPTSSTGGWLLDKRRSSFPSECHAPARTPKDAPAAPRPSPSTKKAKLVKETKAKRSRAPRKSAKSVDGVKRTIPVNWDAAQGDGVAVQVTPRDITCPSEEIFRSGLAHLIDLECHDEDEDENLPSTRDLHAELSVADLCAAPLKPCSLRAIDKANLAAWLQFLFPTTVKGNDNQDLAVITPDHFDWYFHKRRVIGIAEDMHDRNRSLGKILLGSFMKKPLWVDHSANTVFFLLTSSVKVNMDCNEYSVHAGNFFMVPCGHAYSIQNLAPQPAVLCFNRTLSETPD
ncbi:uncharacterized protein LOC144199070 isoform X2 [Stigmatopora nigra]